jgi:4-hydroxythreonine-4-phosphate dehydrogenase
MHPRLGVTTGDPAGIGPEISLRAAQDPSVRGSCCLFLFGDFEILRAQAHRLGLPFDFERISPKDLAGPLPERAIVDIPAEVGQIQPGKGSKASGEAAARNIHACTEGCKGKLLRAMITAPLNKAWLKAAGYPYPGHTEFLAHLTGIQKFAMAFLTDRLKVVLATIHLPLTDAIRRISAALIVEKLSIMLTEFPRLGLPCDKVAVAAMNPHAGEGGLLGAEEAETIEPAVVQVRTLFPNVLIEGPIPADTLFYRAANGEFDAVLALFHDQGLSPIKLIGFGEAVNLTLGLPFVRTSVDHGTAYDIAGKGLARHQSMLSAIRWALRLSQPR